MKRRDSKGSSEQDPPQRDFVIRESSPPPQMPDFKGSIEQDSPQRDFVIIKSSPRPQIPDFEEIGKP